MHILGISPFYHDSAAALIRDGEIVAAAQEERFTRRKHDPRFPSNAVAYCLAEAKIAPADLDAVVFYEKPMLKAERLLETYLGVVPRGLASFLVALPAWLRDKGNIPPPIQKKVGPTYKNPILFTEHHQSHAASAFYPSPFEEAVVVTADGVGEWATTTIGYGQGKKITLLKELD